VNSLAPPHELEIKGRQGSITKHYACLYREKSNDDHEKVCKSWLQLSNRERQEALQHGMRTGGKEYGEALRMQAFGLQHEGR
jgi:hypothetical protein